jgi:hypothetical protein
MAKLSQCDLKIIEKYPLSSSRDSLEGLLQDAEKPYELRLNSYDGAVNNLDYQKVISRLLSILQREEAAFNLRS